MTYTINDAVAFLRDNGTGSLAACISTGSGQPLILRDVPVLLEVEYGRIPGMGDSTIFGHQGILRVVEGSDGRWAVWVGRRHYYQGFKHPEIGWYVEISRSLGAESLFCINAAGGLRMDLNIGDFIVIDRFRSFIPPGDGIASLDGGPWRETSAALKRKMVEAGRICGMALLNGSYVGVPGPTYETAAEVGWLRKLGCDVVGMSTTPELIRASELGMDMLALSVVANVHGITEKLSHEEVVRNSMLSEERLGSLISAFLTVGSAPKSSGKPVV